MSVTTVHSATGVGLPNMLRKGERLTYSITVAGGGDEVSWIERTNDFQTWEVVVPSTAVSVSGILQNDTGTDMYYRSRSEQVGGAFTGTHTTVLTDVAETIQGGSFTNNAGVEVFKITEEGCQGDVVDATVLKINGTTVTATAAELNAIAGGGLSAAELAVLDGATAGTQVASKVVVADSNVNTGVSKVTELHIGVSGSETKVNATAAEINAAADDSANTESIDSGVAASVTKRHTAIDNTVTGAGAITLDVPSAAMIGKIKIIEMTVDNGDVTLALTNVVGGSAVTTCTWSAINQALILIGGTNKWHVIAESGVALT